MTRKTCLLVASLSFFSCSAPGHDSNDSRHTASANASAQEPLLHGPSRHPRARPGHSSNPEEFRAKVVFDPALIGREVSLPRHLENGQEFRVRTSRLLRHGKDMFVARWTTQEGQGRPFGKGNDGALTDPTSPLSFPHNFNRISGPAAGSCSGCHNQPRDGGGGDLVGSVFVLGNRFDFASFDPSDTVPIRGRLDERGIPATFQTISVPRKTTGMFGSGFIEMLARRMSEELRQQAADCASGTSCPLSSKGVSFGTITRNPDGTWDTTAIDGLPPPSTASQGNLPPSLLIQPFFQSGAVVSLRHFTVNAFNRLHGMQAEERFGTDLDPDQDGFTNELTRADVTAITVFQATLPPPGQVIPRRPNLEQAILHGERLFADVGCATCHVPRLPLLSNAWLFTEPGPFNPPTTLQIADVDLLYQVDLTNRSLPSPRLPIEHGVVWVPAYTDLKLHDITSGLPSCSSNPELISSQECDPDVEALSQNHPAGSEEFFAGNSRFLTRRLWGIANQHAFGHHGQYTTIRESVLAHRGEANSVRQSFENLAAHEQAEVIEFIKSLQILPPDTRCLLVDEHGRCRRRPRLH